MIYQRALFTFVAAGVATVGGFTSKAAQGRGVVSTATTAIIERGATSIPVANQDDFMVGDIVEISSSAGKEKSKMIGVGSIIISSNCPITLEHPAGATVTVVTGGDFICEETTAPTVSPSTAPSASPTTAPSATPTEAPSASPSEAPTEAPTASPTPFVPRSCCVYDNDACDGSTVKGRYANSPYTCTCSCKDNCSCCWGGVNTDDCTV